MIPVDGLMSTDEGLSGGEAARRLAVYGPNEPAPVRRLSALAQLFQLFANPLAIILLVASAIAGIRNPLDAAILQQPAADVTGYRKKERIPSRSVASATLSVATDPSRSTIGSIGSSASGVRGSDDRCI
jgi:cation transport ATPase-like protein